MKQIKINLDSLKLNRLLINNKLILNKIWRANKQSAWQIINRIPGKNFYPEYYFSIILRNISDVYEK